MAKTPIEQGPRPTPGPPRRKPSFLSRVFLRYFLRGLLVTAPILLTGWIVWEVFRRVDGLIPLPEQVAPGIGFALVIALITLIGLVASNYLAAKALQASEQLFERVPFVKLLYTSIKDLTEAFVGEKKTFDRPVLLELVADVQVIGFVTRDDLAELGLRERVAVYVPQSYNFAANLLVVPPARLTPIDKPASEVMAFVVSGGVTS
jgi:uncharacterized membrane protein